MINKDTTQHRWGWLNWSGLMLLAVVVALLLARSVVRSAFRVVIDYNEGWNGYHTQRLLTGQPLYDSQAPWTPLEYPPLSFLLIAGISRSTGGDPLVVGRLVSLISLLAVATQVAWAVRLAGGQHYDAILAAILCLGLFAALAGHYVAMNDPQILGHALGMAGLIAYLYASRHRTALLLSAGLFVASLFIKYNLVALPAAVGLHLLIRTPRRFAVWLGCAAAGAAAMFLAAYLTWGDAFVGQLTMNLVSWEWGLTVSRSLEMGYRLVLPLLLLGAWVLAAWWQMARNNRLVLLSQGLWTQERSVVMFYLPLAAGLGIWTAGGTGSDVNVFFDLFVALALAAGLFAADVRDRLRSQPWLATAVSVGLPLVLGSSIFGALPTHAIRPHMLHELGHRQEAFDADVAFLRMQPGPAICETLVLCYYAGKTFEYDPYNAGEMIMRGLRDERAILELLEKGYYSVVQLNRPLPESYTRGDRTYTAKPERSAGRYQRFTENFRIALGRHYVLARQTGSRCFYVPR